MYKIGVIGYGKMAGSIVSGILNKGLYKKDEILLCVRRDEHKLELESLGFNVTLDRVDIYTKCSMIILGIKPQMFPSVLSDSINYDFNDKVIISIAAGINILTLSQYFKNAYILRAMPNTPALISKGVTTLCYNSDRTNFIDALQVIEAFSTYVEIEESQMDTTLPLNGSMPAYIFAFVKEFIDISMKYNVSYEDSLKLVVETIESSMHLIKNSTDTIDTLINNVCSKGGTTIAGLEKMYENGFKESISSCYIACMKRSIELGQK